MSHGREAPVTPCQGIPSGTRHCAVLSRLTSPLPASLPGQGEGASAPPLYLCALGNRSRGPCDHPEPQALPEEGAEGRAGSGRGTGARGESVTLVHRPHDAEGMAVPQLERSLSLHLEGMGAWRAGREGLCVLRPGAKGAPSSKACSRGALAEEPVSGPGAARLRSRSRSRLPAPGSGSRRVGVGAARARLTREGTRLPSRRSVFIGFQCSKITGFPHCFLLFIQHHGNHWIPSISKTEGFPANFTLRNP